MSEDWRPIAHDLAGMIINPSLPREELRAILNYIQRRAAHACLLIDQEVIRELKDLRRAMPEHGFTSEPRAITTEALIKAATIEDMLA